MERYVIKKENSNGSSGYFLRMSNTPEWVSERTQAKHFQTKEKAEQKLSEVAIYALGKVTVERVKV